MCVSWYFHQRAGMGLGMLVARNLGETAAEQDAKREITVWDDFNWHSDPEIFNEISGHFSAKKKEESILGQNTHPNQADKE